MTLRYTNKAPTRALSSEEKKELRKKKDAEPTKDVTVITKVIKSDTYLVLADSAREVEDQFFGLYYSENARNNVVLEPPMDPAVIARLPTLNNILSQCIEAMEVNIDGTGFEFVNAEGDEETPDETEKTLLEGFFNEPFPGKSFVSIRRELRRDLETLGYGALEILRNVGGDVVGLRNFVGRDLRLVKLDGPVQVTKTIQRAGKDVSLTYQARERRFVSIVGSDRQMLYFREFGASRQLNKRTGDWEFTVDDKGTTVRGEPIKPEDRASELLLFYVNKDTDSAYGLPRWINQMPSVIGSRKTEEQNLEFFDSGGVPPAIVFLLGGAVANKADQELRTLLSGQTKSRNRVVVAPVQSTSSSVEDTSAKVDVQVERFGADSVNDSLYANYDDRAEQHVRKSFRLPPLFLGEPADYNFATAYTAYMVAEEQVFQPERMEFDEIINKNIVPALGVKKTKMKSKGITMKNIDAQLTALGLVKDIVSGDSFVEDVNRVSGTSVEFDAAKEQAAADLAKTKAQGGFFGPDGKRVNDPKGGANANPGGNPPGQDEGQSIKQLNQDGENKAPALRPPALKIAKLASEWLRAQGLGPSKMPVTKAEQDRLDQAVAALGPAEELLFDAFVAASTYGAVDRSTRELARAHRCAA